MGRSRSNLGTKRNVRFANLYLAGAPKCGTTSLAYWLGQHPDIFSPVMKEPVIFGSDLTSKNPRDPIAMAAAHYAKWHLQTYALDATTHYFFSDNAAREIFACSPNAEIIILVRNPVEAVPSLYYQLRFNGTETLASLEASLDAESDRASSGKPPRFGGFLETHLYSRVYRFSANISRFVEVFGRDQVQVFLLEDMNANPRAMVHSIFDKLDLESTHADLIDYAGKNSAKRSRSRWVQRFAAYPPTWFKTLARPFLSRDQRAHARNWLIRVNTVSATNPPLHPETRQRLINQFRPEVEWLSGFLDRDLSHWLRDD